jgi:hypothetical protein
VYTATTHVAIVTPVGNPVLVSTDASAGRLRVNLRTSSGNGGNVVRNFHFIIYKP